MGEDLFPLQAWLYRSCHNTFNLWYFLHLCDKDLKKDQTHLCDKDPKKDQKGAAHQSAFHAVLDLIHERVIDQKEVLQLKVL